MEITSEQITDLRDFTRATPIERLVARIIDRFIAVFAGVIVGFSFAAINETAGISAGILTALAYLFFRDAFPFLNGQSIGKKAFSIKVADANYGTGIEGKYLKAFLREIPTVIPLISLIDALMIFSNNQRMGDGFANTIVVSVPKR